MTERHEPACARMRIGQRPVRSHEGAPGRGVKNDEASRRIPDHNISLCHEVSGTQTSGEDQDLVLLLSSSQPPLVADHEYVNSVQYGARSNVERCYVPGNERRLWSLAASGA